MNGLDFGLDAFLPAFAAVPDGALAYRHPGDDYAVGGILEHVDYVVRRYSAVARAIAAAGFGSIEAPIIASNHALEHDGFDAMARPAGINRLLDHHRELAAALAALGDSGRKAPVVYGRGEGPYPTSGSDLEGWVADHYLEHISQLSVLAAEWRTVDVIDRFNERFGAHDVPGFTALMTEDVVFDNTYPPPDGERFEGRDAVAAFFTEFFRSTPSAQFETEEIVAAGARAVVRWRFDWGDGHVRGIDLFRIQDGLVAEKRSYVKG